jgi:hypothetical protein
VLAGGCPQGNPPRCSGPGLAPGGGGLKGDLRPRREQCKRSSAHGIREGVAAGRLPGLRDSFTLRCSRECVRRRRRKAR